MWSGLTGLHRYIWIINFSSNAWFMQLSNTNSEKYSARLSVRVPMWKLELKFHSDLNYLTEINEHVPAYLIYL